MYQNLCKPILFRIDPEKVHDRFVALGHTLGNFGLGRALVRALCNYDHPALAQDIFGIHFRNPIGLSAGFDKDANLVNILPSVGFGFAQIGTVTANPYPGNPKPRLTRLKKSKGLIVYYGLKNEGSKKIAQKLKNVSLNIPFGVSIGKTNSPDTCKLQEGIEDYIECLHDFADADIGSWYTINISCPNVYGGEPFTTPEKLQALFDRIQALDVKKPIFVKMPINLDWEAFARLLDVLMRFDVAGVIIGNLNKDFHDPSITDRLPEHPHGGVSGKPAWKRSNELISKTYTYSKSKLLIIGAGGVFSAEDAYEKIKRGATLVQLITGMIYEGPQLIGEINSGIVQLLKKDRLRSISEAVGAYHR